MSTNGLSKNPLLSPTKRFEKNKTKKEISIKVVRRHLEIDKRRRTETEEEILKALNLLGF